MVWFATPVSELAFPTVIPPDGLPQALLSDHSQYVTATLSDLHFTGYTQTIFDHTTGYYYYTFRDGKCLIVLLSPETCEEGLPVIEDAVTVHARVIKNFRDYRTLTSDMAKDLHWTNQGVRDKVLRCLISEPAYHRTTTSFLLGFYLLSGVYALLQLAVCTAYIFHPALSPTCRELGLYGNAAALLAQAEEELATLPQLATEDMYITEHFFIAFASYRVAVVPIQEIIWIYKHSTLHKFLSYHFSISYTLHIIANRHLYIQCPKNMKSDIDGIIDYLGEANHNILTGFSEENRQKVQEIVRMPRITAAIMAFLNHRI